MHNPLTAFLARLRQERRRRDLSRTLASLNDHLLRDIGIERKFIDAVVEAQMPIASPERRVATPPIVGSGSAHALQGCG